MSNGLMEKLRGARKIELFAALAVASLLALLLFSAGTGGKDSPQETALESRLERILSRIEGAGDVNAMVNQDSDGNTTGAVIVAEGLEDVQTYLQLQRAVSTLLELEPEKIEIIGRNWAKGVAK